MKKEDGLKRLDSIRNWKHNWDGEGGLFPLQKDIDTAVNLLNCLPDSIEFGVDLNADSQPTFHLRNLHFTQKEKDNPDQYKSFSITIEHDSKVSFYMVADDRAVDGYDLDFDGINLPPTLKAVLESMI